MALSYSAVWRVPVTLDAATIGCSEFFEFASGGIGPATPLIILGLLKTSYEELYGGTLSWTVVTDATYNTYSITWTGLTTDPEIDPSPFDDIYRGTVVGLVYGVESGPTGSGGFQWIYEDLCQDTGNCPQCPPSVNPEDATDCPTCYDEQLPFCDTPISILGLDASTEYDFKIQDQATGRIYTYTTTTDSNGQADLTVSDFPTGLFTPYNGPFTITIFDVNGDPVVLTYGYVNYSCVEVTITNSTDYTP